MDKLSINVSKLDSTINSLDKSAVSLLNKSWNGHINKSKTCLKKDPSKIMNNSHINFSKIIKENPNLNENKNKQVKQRNSFGDEDKTRLYNYKSSAIFLKNQQKLKNTEEQMYNLNKSKSKNKLNFNQFVNRVNEAEKNKIDKINNSRELLKSKEHQTLQTKPNINKKSNSMVKGKQNFFQREKKFEEHKIKNREILKDKFTNKETIHKNPIPTKVIHKRIESFNEWQNNRIAKLERKKKEVETNMLRECTFNPSSKIPVLKINNDKNNKVKKAVGRNFVKCKATNIEIPGKNNSMMSISNISFDEYERKNVDAGGFIIASDLRETIKKEIEKETITKPFDFDSFNELANGETTITQERKLVYVKKKISK